MVGQQNKPQLLKGLEIGDREGTNLDSMQPKAALRNGQPAPAQARSGWIMRFVFRTAGPSSQLIWTAVRMPSREVCHVLASSSTSSSGLGTCCFAPNSDIHLIT